MYEHVSANCLQSVKTNILSCCKVWKPMPFRIFCCLQGRCNTDIKGTCRNRNRSASILLNHKLRTKYPSDQISWPVFFFIIFGLITHFYNYKLSNTKERFPVCWEIFPYVIHFLGKFLERKTKIVLLWSKTQLIWNLCWKLRKIISFFINDAMDFLV